MSNGLLDQRIQLHLALRSWNRVRLGLVDRPDGRHRAGWVALTIVGLAADQAYARWLASDARPHPWVRTAVGSIEAGVWALAGRESSSTSQSVQFMTVIPAALEHGLRSAAGTTAVPVPVGARPWPSTPRETIRTAADALVPMVAPLAALRLVRKRRGLGFSRVQFLLGPMASLTGVLLGRYRERAHDRARGEWSTRTEAQVLRERDDAGVRAALAASPGHDFKKVLTALAVAGSEPARVAALRQSSHPAEVVDGSGGTTLLRAAWGMPVEPIGSLDLWVSQDQCARFDRFVEEVDELLDDAGPPPGVVVEQAGGAAIVLRYRGQRLTLHNPAPRLEADLDPVPVGLIASACWKLVPLASSNVGVAAGWTLPSAALELGFASSYTRLRGTDGSGPVETALIVSLTSTLLYDIGLVRSARPHQDAAAEPSTAAANAAAGTIALLAAHRHRVGERFAALVALGVIAGWTAVMVAEGERSWRFVGAEALLLIQVYHAALGTGDRIAAEGEILERDLQDEFARRVSSARSAASRTELDRFRAQVALAEHELPLVQHELDPAIVTFVERQCEEVKAWLHEHDKTVLGS